MPDKDVESILARLRQEFIETARDQIDEIETCLDWFESGRNIDSEELFGVQRSIHNIKGQGSTFGFPLVGRIAHLCEDYLKNVGGVQLGAVRDIRIFLDTMRDILMAGSEDNLPDPEAMLRTLPSGKPEEFSGQVHHDVHVLLVMPEGIVRRTIAAEMLSCGFHVRRSINTLDALSYAMDVVPDIVISDYETSPFTGLELARVFASIDKLSQAHFVLFTTYEMGDDHLHHVPDNVSILPKTRDYANTLTEMLIDWGVFGKVKAS
ncbi:Hpt domain-containing protein [Magnetovibrio sp. PR-2]|uniref:Hpt domain-containing protein n=1 Tax=Magnetovibrio sp. PR-2 TaxID=3120356 RepID=UPI002FCE663D